MPDSGQFSQKKAEVGFGWFAGICSPSKWRRLHSLPQKPLSFLNYSRSFWPIRARVIYDVQISQSKLILLALLQWNCPKADDVAFHPFAAQTSNNIANFIPFSLQVLDWRHFDVFSVYRETQQLALLWNELFFYCACVSTWLNRRFLCGIRFGFEACRGLRFGFGACRDD